MWCLFSIRGLSIKLLGTAAFMLRIDCAASAFHNRSKSRVYKLLSRLFEFPLTSVVSALIYWVQLGILCSLCFELACCCIHFLWANRILLKKTMPIHKVHRCFWIGRIGSHSIFIVNMRKCHSWIESTFYAWKIWLLHACSGCYCCAFVLGFLGELERYPQCVRHAMHT